MTSVHSRLSQLLKRNPHAHKQALLRVLSSRTSLSSSGFPYISQPLFRLVLDGVPHLFEDGSALLAWLASVEKKVAGAATLLEEERESVGRAIRVLRNIVYSAAICAPPDLWVLRHVLSAHASAGVNALWLSGSAFTADQIALRLGLDAGRLQWDLDLLNCRGYLDVRNRKYKMANHSQARQVFHRASILPVEHLRDLTEPIRNVLTGEATREEETMVSEFLQFKHDAARHRGWHASYAQVELGYRIVPLILALHTTKSSPKRNLTREMKNLLRHAGLALASGKFTELGTRVLERGPGPFGIIHAYTPHMAILADRLSGKAAAAHVNRLKNIAASQDANRKTFLMANDSLDVFCRDHGFEFRVFIEHALGQGEAVRQRFKKEGESSIQYFGADLEDAAIDRARELQRQGILPKNMMFAAGADIGVPDLLLRVVRKSGYPTESAVMFVGNGFHEVRGQNNEKVIEIFREYCEAGILLVFTEESALSDHDLISTAWNTYHAGFRYMHELSGQGLRPAYGTDRTGKHSWKICASLAGYAVLQKYSAHTRTIYPFPRKGGYNPPISMTYFCVPDRLARRLGWFPGGWSHH